MNVAIIGSRDFNNYELVVEYMQQLNPTTIVSGGARGADALGKRYALEHAINYVEFKADWKQYGRGAGMVRNKEIIAHADYVLAFWDGESKGTKHSISLAEKLGKG